VEEQSSRELASANPTPRTQDAGLQEPRISPTISFNPCSRLQHFQRPTPSDLSVDAPWLSRHGNGNLAYSGRLRVYGTQPSLRSPSSNVTTPFGAVEMLSEAHVEALRRDRQDMARANGRIVVWLTPIWARFGQACRPDRRRTNRRTNRRTASRNPNVLGTCWGWLGDQDAHHTLRSPLIPWSFPPRRWLV
jgi:hypothetical protein